MIIGTTYSSITGRLIFQALRASLNAEEVRVERAANIYNTSNDACIGVNVMAF